MTDREITTELERLVARQAATEQSLLEVAEVLLTVVRHLREMPNLDVVGRSEIGAAGHVLRQITIRH
jgi:hypothetical protein